MKRKLQFDVVPESEHTDFSDREEKPFGNGALLGAGIAATASLSTYAVTKYINRTAAHTTAAIPPADTAIPPVITPANEPLNVLSDYPSTDVIPVSSPEVIQTGFIGDASLDILTTVLDPLVHIMVAISFPIASVVMIGSCFYFMFDNKEKAWGGIMNAALGYVVIQLSPLFLNIMKNVGESVGAG